MQLVIAAGALKGFMTLVTNTLKTWSLNKGRMQLQVPVKSGVHGSMQSEVSAPSVEQREGHPLRLRGISKVTTARAVTELYAKNNGL